MKKYKLSSILFISIAAFCLLTGFAFGQSIDALIVTESGNVGIGTTTPSEKLDVDGAVKAKSLDVDGTVNATKFEGDGSGLTGIAHPWSEHREDNLETFESRFGDWINVTNLTGDDFDWTRNTSSTTSFATGPPEAYGGTYYIYTESSSPNYPNKTAILESVDLTSMNVASIDFWYHMYGSAMGTLYLEYHDGSTWNVAWSLTGNQGDTWYNAVVDLSSYTVQKLRFRAYTGTSYTSDFSLDDVNIIEAVDPSISYTGGKVGIGTTTPSYTLHVNGTIGTTNSGQVHSDYVFEPGYNLRSLGELDDFIKKEKHLPGIITDPEKAPDIEILRLNGKLLEKIEELTLYLIEQNKRVSALEEKIKKLRNRSE